MRCHCHYLGRVIIYINVLCLHTDQQGTSHKQQVGFFLNEFCYSTLNCIFFVTTFQEIAEHDRLYIYLPTIYLSTYHLLIFCLNIETDDNVEFYIFSCTVYSFSIIFCTITTTFAHIQ